MPCVEGSSKLAKARDNFVKACDAFLAALILLTGLICWTGFNYYHRQVLRDYGITEGEVTGHHIRGGTHLKYYLAIQLSTAGASPQLFRLERDVSNQLNRVKAIH